MRVALSWLAEFVDLPDPVTTEQIDAAFVRMGLEVEEIATVGADVHGPLVIGAVLEIEELTGFKKPIRFCQVRVGPEQIRGIVCGATNFVVGDHVVVAMPGAVLPGGFEIAARTTYGHVSDGMICSARELDLGADATGILVLPADSRVGADGVAVLGLNDMVVELAITPDRGYCLSIRGLARELALGLRVAFRDPAAAIVPLRDGPPPYDVRVEDTVGCDRFVAAVVDGIDPSRPSPLWMTRRLATAGVRSISLAVDVTNYVMLELGQPMHAFDRDRIQGPIVVRRAAAGERVRTLDGVERTADPEDLLLTDDSGPIGLAAVMGGLSTEVVDSTRAVLLEAAHWDPVTVARSARRHRLVSEASKRFERGVDPEMTRVAVARAAALLVEYGGGRALAGVLDLDHRVPGRPIQLDAELPAQVAGVQYPPESVVAALTDIGCAVEGSTSLAVLPPPWRPDLTDPADLCEEVTRVDGYDAVPSILPLAPAGRGLTAGQRRRRSIGRALAEAGYVEAPAYPFLDPGIFDVFGLGDEDPRRRAVRLANPVSEQEPAMRTTLLPGLLKTLARNHSRGQRDVALFELGLVFLGGDQPPPPSLGVDRRPDEAETSALLASVPPQPWHVAVALTGQRQPAGWWGSGETSTWGDAVEAARIVGATAGVQLSVRAGQHPPWHPGRCAELVVADRVVGRAGELHPGVLSALELPRGVCAMELDLDALPAAGVVPAPTISAFPPALVDVALVVPLGVPATDVTQALSDGAGEWLETVRLFDVFTGIQVGEGRRSLAFALSFRAPDRTLTTAEVTAARDAAVAEARRRTGAELRG
ncbi:MAG: phenylalanine--tRNA ligase subunit beta [Geodermatophilaceae bacterium]|nr:phenylalanine--tRNA ligase subunit beta [Geodermatophilaceae bacterium]